MQKKGELVVVHTYQKVVKFWFWQNRLYVRTPFHVSRGKILHFKQPRLFAVNRMATRTFREKNNNKVESFFRRDFNVFIDVDNRERGRARDNKQRRIISLDENMKKVKRRWGKEKCQTSTTMNASETKKRTETPAKFSSENVQLGSFRCKTTTKEMYKKVSAARTNMILLIRPIVCFFACFCRTV